MSRGIRRNRSDEWRSGFQTGGASVRISFGADGGITEASYSRTARRIMDGTVYVRRSALAA